MFQGKWMFRVVAVLGLLIMLPVLLGYDNLPGANDTTYIVVLGASWIALGKFCHERIRSEDAPYDTEYLMHWYYAVGTGMWAIAFMAIGILQFTPSYPVGVVVLAAACELMGIFLCFITVASDLVASLLILTRRKHGSVPPVS